MPVFLGTFKNVTYVVLVLRSQNDNSVMNNTPEVETMDYKLYYAAIEADEAYHAAVVAEYGLKNACHARYKIRHENPLLNELAAAKYAADDAWIAQMRKETIDE